MLSGSFAIQKFGFVLVGLFSLALGVLFLKFRREFDSAAQSIQRGLGCRSAASISDKTRRRSTIATGCVAIAFGLFAMALGLFSVVPG